MFDDVTKAIDRLLEMAREAQAQKERERIIIGHIFDVPPIQLTEKQIEDYKRKIWAQSLILPFIRRTL